jgi:endo-1,4-beta-D-glucanase Y
VCVSGGGGTGGGSSNGGSTSTGGGTSTGGVGGGTGTTGGTAGSTSTGGSGGGTTVGRNGCENKAGLIADFEEGVAAPAMIAHEGRSGEWEMFNDKTSTSQTMTVEASGGTAMCDKYALHVKGSGYSMWGAGFGFSLAGPAMDPKAYDAAAQQFTGIRFKAKLGAAADPKSPVRFNISTPWTENSMNPGGECMPTAATATKAGRDCYQHAGRFMPPGAGDGELTQAWKTITYCFDRDLYPLSLPSNLSNVQRDTIATKMLKVQFQFNQGKDYSGAYTTMYPAFAKSLPFDFWLDDVTFIKGECPNMTPSPSNGSPAKAFPQNTPVGTCMPPANAPKFASAIAQIYARWTKTFVQDSGTTAKIVAPEQQGAVTSEAMGYGMMIAAAMGDEAAYKKFWAYVQSKLSNGLMTWKDGASGSASDGDIDIAYALLMGHAQWPSGGYKTASDAMAARILTDDIVDSVVRGGSNFKQAPFNASYFAPAAFRKFTGFAAAITKNYQLVEANVSAPTAGIPTDWANAGTGAPSGSGGAEVTSMIVDGDNGAMGYDSARVPWRLGLDACLGGGNTTALKAIVDHFAAKYDAGASIDLLKAGWYKAQGGAVHTAAINLQASYIGPMAAGGMAMGNTAMRDRGFRVILDILESGDFNHTYFPSTVGLLTLLMMSGNFPTP